MTRLAFLIDKLGAGGAQTHLGGLVRGLDRTRFAISVVCLKKAGRTAAELVDLGFDVRTLGLSRLYAPRGALACWQLASWLERERVDILHTYLSAANVFGAVAARLAGTPCLITTRRDTGFADGRCMSWALSATSRWATRVVAVSQDAARVARRRDGVGDERLLVIPNGIDTHRFSRRRTKARARHDLGLSVEDPLVVMVGHVTRVKGVDILVEAAVEMLKKLPKIRFVVAGDGDAFDTVNDMIQQHGLEDRFQLLGRCDDVPGLLEAGDVFVSASRAEGMPNAVLEAMAMGIPIVASRVGGVPEVVSDGEDALVVESENASRLADACLTLLREPEVGHGLAASARRRVAREFDLDVMLRRYESLYTLAIREARLPVGPSVS